MLHLRETVTCAFLSYDSVSTTVRTCLLGAFNLSLRPRPLVRVPRMTFESRLRDFWKRQAFPRRTLLVFKVCPLTGPIQVNAFDTYY